MMDIIPIWLEEEPVILSGPWKQFQLKIYIEEEDGELASGSQSDAEGTGRVIHPR